MRETAVKWISFFVHFFIFIWSIGVFEAESNGQSSLV